MAEACRAAAAAMEAGDAPFQAAVSATRILEDCPITNAGKGSNLTEDGTVECDAAVMDGRGVFGAVGACPGERIQCAKPHLPTMLRALPWLAI